MAIIFIEVKEEVYFFLGLVRGGAKSVGTAEFAFESDLLWFGGFGKIEELRLFPAHNKLYKGQKLYVVGQGQR